jgi:chromosome segregation ATPase
MNENEIIIDNKHGISIEEQQEILSGINKIAEKNRQSLSHNMPADKLKSGKQPVINAKKSGALFPLIINIAAIVILAGGALFLVSFNNRKDAQVRVGNVVFDTTERALIEEIRRDTAARIAEKENEINSINSRLEDVDAQLLLLYSSNIELTAEQLTAQERLLSMQAAYRTDLSALHEERSQILEASRSREARLRALLEERNREFAAAQQQASRELDTAMSELERLASEQERAAALDAQLAGGLGAVAILMQNNQLDQAAHAVESLRVLCNTGALAVSRSFQPRREFYNQAFNSMEIAIEEMRRSTAAGAAEENRDLAVRNLQLEESIAEMQRTITSFSADSTGQAHRLVELEESVTSLRTANSALETASAEKDRTISSLESERVTLGQNVNTLNQNVSTLNQTVADLRHVNAEQEQEIVNLSSQLALIRQVIQ